MHLNGAVNTLSQDCTTSRTESESMEFLVICQIANISLNCWSLKRGNLMEFKMYGVYEDLTFRSAPPHMPLQMSSHWF